MNFLPTQEKTLPAFQKVRVRERRLAGPGNSSPELQGGITLGNASSSLELRIRAKL